MYAFAVGSIRNANITHENPHKLIEQQLKRLIARMNILMRDCPMFAAPLHHLLYMSALVIIITHPAGLSPLNTHTHPEASLPTPAPLARTFQLTHTIYCANHCRVIARSTKPYQCVAAAPWRVFTFLFPPCKQVRNDLRAHIIITQHKIGYGL